MRLRTKVIALGVLVVFLTSVGAMGVASANGASEVQRPTILIMGIEPQIVSSSESIALNGALYTGDRAVCTDQTIKVYEQRLGLTTSPVLVATTTTSMFDGRWVAMVSFPQAGDYYVYAAFDGGTRYDKTPLAPSQTGFVKVKVLPKLILGSQARTLEKFLRKPTQSALDISPDDVFQIGQGAYLNDILVTGYVWYGGAFSYGKSHGLNGTVSLSYQYKASPSDSWSTATRLRSQTTHGNADWTLRPADVFKEPGYYRFQMTFAGDPVWKIGGYDASKSNYVDVVVTVPIIPLPG